MSDLTFMRGTEGSESYIVQGDTEHLRVGVRPLTYEYNGHLFMGFRVRAAILDEALKASDYTDEVGLSPWTKQNSVRLSYVIGTYLPMAELAKDTLAPFIDGGLIDAMYQAILSYLPEPMPTVRSYAVKDHYVTNVYMKYKVAMEEHPTDVTYANKSMSKEDMDSELQDDWVPDTLRDKCVDWGISFVEKLV